MMSQILAAKLEASKTIQEFSKGFQQLAEQAMKGNYKHKTSSVEVNFNGAKVEESNAVSSYQISASAFGNSNKQNVEELKARICGGK